MSIEQTINPGRILDIAHGFWASKALLTAVELGVFTALAEEKLDADHLRRRIGIHERGAGDFFDALVALGLLDRGADLLYGNTAAADLYLDRQKPDYLGGYLEMLSARLYPFWGRLAQALRTGEPQSEAEVRHGRYPALYADPARLKMVVRAMTGGTLPLARLIAARFPWGEHRSFADIGTAQGALAVELAKSHPHLSGVGFDLPPVRSEFEAYVNSHRLAGRLRFEGGDFLEEPLPKADVLVLGRVLHNWDLATKKLLLRKAYEALPKGGVLVVYERLIDDERRENVMALLSSLNMLVMTAAGFDFTGADCIEWMRETGFKEARAEPLGFSNSMAIGRK